jgi:hypothetical protein
MRIKTADPPLFGGAADKLNTHPPPLPPQPVQKLLLNIRLMSRHFLKHPPRFFSNELTSHQLALEK